MKPLDIPVNSTTIRVLRDLGYRVYTFNAQVLGETEPNYGFLVKRGSVRLALLTGYKTWREAKVAGWKYAGTFAVKAGEAVLKKVLTSYVLEPVKQQKMGSK